MLGKSILVSLLLALALSSTSLAHGAHDGRSAQHRRLAQRAAVSASPDEGAPQESTRLVAVKRADKTFWETETVTQTQTRQLTIRAAPAGATDAATGVSTITSGSTTWARQGCVQDGSDYLLQGLKKVLSSTNTPAVCVQTCLAQGFSYAGVEAGKICLCGSTLNTASGLGGQLDDSSCAGYACPGDSSLYCGSGYRMILYKQTGTASSTTSSAAASLTSSAATSSTAVSSTSSAAITSGSTLWDFLGCLQDGSDRLLQGYKASLSGNTPSACIETCLSKGFSYAGVEAGYICMCGSSPNTASGLGATLDSSLCSSKCTGDSSLTCGGSFKMLLYQQAAITLPTANITSGTTTWAPQGCVQDGSALLLQGSKTSLSGNTPSKCVANCLAQGFSYAGDEAGYLCMCGSSLNTASGLGGSLDDAACTASMCTGDSSLPCGGSYKMLLYQQTAVALPAADITSGTTTWAPQGCLQDGSDRLLQGYKTSLSANTPSACIATCVSKGFSYAGVEAGYICMCGSTLNTASGLGGSLDDSLCTAAMCTGNSSIPCGGSYKMLLYKETGVALPSAEIISGSTSWTPQGCVQDGSALLLQGSKTSLSSNTPSKCIANCLSQGFSYAGVEAGYICMCGSSLNTASGLGGSLDSSLCTASMCTGDSSLPCGGSYKMLLYKQTAGTVTASSSSATASASASTTSSSASKTSSSAAAGTPTGTWSFSHCASDYPYSPQAGRALGGAGPLYAPSGSAGMTNVLCQSMCELKGFTLAGTENGNECWCGSSLDNGNGLSSPSSGCSAACVGDATQKCGGNWRLSLYASSKLKSWSLVKSQEGSTFFDGWDWYSGADPTNGFVDYVTWQDAFSLGLASVNSAGQAIMKVETTGVVTTAGRKSTRISTSWQFNSGSLLVMDATHMPVGCGVWPAWWTLGNGAWPYTGEIDILEGVHFYTNNLQSVHTGSGCSIPTLFGGSGTLVGANNCDAYATGNTGCGIQNNAGTPNYGVPFNDNGGGVYAMLWTDLHIQVYFFPRGSIPADITNKAPTPDKGVWGQPIARWPASQCSPLSNYFKNHAGIFDITFCGDWAGNAWTSGYPDQGQPSSCQALTGYATCNDYVQNRGGDFGEAYWQINSVRLYQ